MEYCTGNIITPSLSSQELEAYSSHLRQKFEEKVRALEAEAGQLRGDLEALMSGTGAVTTMMQQEGLHDLAHSSLGEQVAIAFILLILDPTTKFEAIQYYRD